MTRLSLAVATVLLLPALTLADGERADAHAQDLIFLGKKGPVLIRLHVEVDGQPVQAALEEYCRKWVKYLDRDGDGLLNAEELKRLPDAQGMSQLFQGNFFVPRPGFFNLTPASFGKGNDGKVSAAELAAFYLKAGVAPVRVAPSLVRSQLQSAASTALFNALDLNGDGKLSPEEFARGTEVLRKLDQEDDEYLTPRELAPALANPYGGAAPVVLGQTPDAFYVVPASRNLVQLTALLLAKYDKNKDGRLDRVESGLDKATFNKLDVNKDGYLSIPELMNLLKATRPVTLTVRLGKKDSRQTGIEMTSQGRLKGPAGQGPGKDEVSFFVDDALVAVRRVDLPAVNNYGSGQILLQQFRFANPGNKPFLTMADLAKPQYTYISQIFPIADQNGDGKLTEQEVMNLGTLHDGAKNCYVSLRFNEEGNDFFQLMDANRDGKLSPREILSGWSRLKHLDRKGDGYLSLDALGRQFVIEVHRGQANFAYGAQQRVVFRPGMNQPVSPNGPGRGPLWFQRMDVNGDGDVSEREFLGTPEEFRRIDTNGDGLIDPEEAFAATRSKKE